MILPAIANEPVWMIAIETCVNVHGRWRDPDSRNAALSDNFRCESFESVGEKRVRLPHTPPLLPATVKDDCGPVNAE